MKDATRRRLTAGLPDPAALDPPLVPNGPRGIRGSLFVVGFAWGLLAGACTGAIVGAAMALAGVAQDDGYGIVVLLLAVFGAGFGAAVAVVPSLLGAAFVAQLAFVVPPQATRAEWDAAIGRRLSAIHVVVDAVFLPLIVGWSGAVDTSELLLVVACVLLGNAVVFAVLRAARRALVAALAPQPMPARRA